MDGVGAAGDGGRDDVGDREVRLRGRGVADADGLVRQLDVEAVLVGGGVDGDSGEAELLAGADDADGDLAAVCDEDLRLFFERVLRRRRRGVEEAGREGGGKVSVLLFFVCAFLISICVESLNFSGSIPPGKQGAFPLFLSETRQKSRINNPRMQIRTNKPTRSPW